MKFPSQKTMTVVLVMSLLTAGSAAAFGTELRDVTSPEELFHMSGTVFDTPATEVTSATAGANATLMVLEAIRTRPDEISALKNVSGLDPEQYLRARRAEPAATAEVKRLKLSPGVLLFAQRFPQFFVQDAARAAYGKKNDSDVAALRAKELEAFQDAVATSLASTAHPVAAHTLADAIQHGGDTGARAMAAKVIGLADDTIALRALESVLKDTGAPDALRLAAIVGLGKVHNRPAMKALVAQLHSEKKDERDTAIRVAGNLGSKWALTAEKTEMGPLRHDLSLELVAMLPAVAGTTSAKAIAQSLATIAHDAPVTKLQGLKDSGDAKVSKDASYALRLLKRARAR